MELKALILRAPGINRDADAALACELAGARPERVMSTGLLKVR